MFAVAYPANRVTKSAPVEPTLLMAPAEWRRPVIIIEAHSRDEHWRTEREIIELQPRRPALGALGAPQPAKDPIYVRLLDGEYAD